MKKTIENTLQAYNCPCEVTEIVEGTSVTSYFLQPLKAVRIKKILELQEEMSIATNTTVTIKTTNNKIVVEAKKNKSNILYLSDFITSKYNDNLSVIVGKDIYNNDIVIDISELPHLLVAGTTGSGKSVLINVIVTQLLQKSNTKLILIDPKRVELSQYQDCENLAYNVIDDVNEAVNILNIMVQEMERRYTLLENKKAKNIKEYNNSVTPMYQLYNYIIVIDELADFMITAKKDFELPLTRLLQKARACGINVIAGTQRPDATVLSGLIRANIPSRIALKTASNIDSRMIIGEAGAERLNGKGDMLIKTITSGEVTRGQCFLCDITPHKSNITNYIYEGENKELVKWHSLGFDFVRIYKGEKYTLKDLHSISYKHMTQHNVTNIAQRDCNITADILKNV